jgi:hypothetical protein
MSVPPQSPEGYVIRCCHVCVGGSKRGIENAVPIGLVRAEIPRGSSYFLPPNVQTWLAVQFPYIVSSLGKIASAEPSTYAD